jgi:hypothetical protein
VHCLTEIALIFYFSPDNLVGTASHAIAAAGEIQPATKQRPEVEAN